MRGGRQIGILLRGAGAVALLALLAPSARGEEAPAFPPPPPQTPGKVTLPLREYLTLVEKVESLDRERERENARREMPLAEVVAQRITVSVSDAAEADLTARYEALVQGRPKEPLLLPFHGFAARAEVQSLPGAVVSPSSPAALSAALSEKMAGKGRDGLLLVAPAPGRYAVEVQGRAALEDREGVRRLTLAPIAASVAEIALDLPADLAWSAPGAVVVDDAVAGGRRAVRLAIRRGATPVLEVQRRLSGTEATKLLAQSVVLTLFQLRPDGLRRHDVVLYEVSRGSLASLAVDLPGDLAVEQVATDEGDVVPVVDAHHLTVHRRRQLTGIGYLVLTSTPSPGAALPASAVVPGIEVRARYLAVASSVAANVAPTPAASWSRVDLSDLPPALGEALQALDLTAAWRLTSPAPSPALAVTSLPPPSRLPTLVGRRETTTLLTVDGTLVHRDRFTLDQAGPALDLTLPTGAVLWSAQVDGQAVRPVARGGGLAVPLGFAVTGEGGAAPVVEVVSVLERTIPKGRSELRLALPQVAAPVALHQWRLLLPEGARYRFRSGDLKPTRERPEAERSSIAYADHGPGGSAGVRGKVVDKEGEALPGVTVAVSGGGFTKPLFLVTRADGTFLLSDLPPGSYTVKAELEGFQATELPVRVPPGKFADLTIELRNVILEETIVVTGETAPLRDRREVLREEEKRKKDERIDFDAFQEEARQLQNGLVGGVKPLPVDIPETGKLLLLTGALPPAAVGVELEVKGKG